MGVTPKRRGGSSGGGGAAMTVKAKKTEDHILLARGLSARYTGANTPLTALTADEIEKDLRHMEAFANACTAYSQQYYIYQNQKEKEDGRDDGKPNNNNNHGPPLVAMPIRIDPEEEKRLANLRQKIQQCEAQREIVESQYLSLRAHYVHISHVLKGVRSTVNKQTLFLQKMVQKRGKVVALQRVRLQIVREVLKCLQYRKQAGKNANSDDRMDSDSADLVEIWNEIEDKLKKAERDCRKDGTEQWHALSMPKTPTGVPIFLSQLSNTPDRGGAFGTGGMFGSSQSSLCWLEDNLPKEPPNFSKILSLREKVDNLKSELEMERNLNRDLQSKINDRRQRNDELVAMMALLRSETEAEIARHNILLESEEARDAAYSIHAAAQEEKNAAEAENEDAADEVDDSNEPTTAAADTPAKQEDLAAEDTADATAVVPTTNSMPTDASPVAKTDAEEEKDKQTVPTQKDEETKPARHKVEDDENDGDDEGQVGEEDEDEEGEILEDEPERSPMREFIGGDHDDDDDDNDSHHDGDDGGPERSIKRRKI